MDDLNVLGEPDNESRSLKDTNSACVDCHSRYAQDGPYCRRCARARAFRPPPPKPRAEPQRVLPRPEGPVRTARYFDGEAWREFDVLWDGT